MSTSVDAGNFRRSYTCVDGDNLELKKKLSDSETLRRFGKHIRLLIQKRGYSSPYEFWVQQAGEEMSRASLNYILAGKREPKLLTILTLARLLRVPPHELFEFDLSKRVKND